MHTGVEQFEVVMNITSGNDEAHCFREIHYRTLQRYPGIAHRCRQLDGDSCHVRNTCSAYLERGENEQHTTHVTH